MKINLEMMWNVFGSNKMVSSMMWSGQYEKSIGHLLLTDDVMWQRNELSEFWGNLLKY